jgi:hypothetical protein
MYFGNSYKSLLNSALTYIDDVTSPGQQAFRHLHKSIVQVLKKEKKEKRSEN